MSEAAPAITRYETRTIGEVRRVRSLVERATKGMKPYPYIAPDGSLGTSIEKHWITKTDKWYSLAHVREEHPRVLGEEEGPVTERVIIHSLEFLEDSPSTEAITIRYVLSLNDGRFLADHDRASFDELEQANKELMAGSKDDWEIDYDIQNFMLEMGAYVPEPGDFKEMIKFLERVSTS